MESLPVEITFDIAKNLSAEACLRLVESSKQYLWIRDEVSLWKYFAVRDLKFPESLFERQLGSMNPAQLYQHLSRCQHLESIAGTIFVQRCGQNILPGTPYCREHCAGHSIWICPCCQIGLVNVVDYLLVYLQSHERFCRTCFSTEAWKNECRHVHTRGFHRGYQCGSKREPGSEYCRDCLGKSEVQEELARRQNLAQQQNSAPPTINIINNIFQLEACSIPGHYVLASESRSDIVVRRRDNGLLLAVGRIPSRQTKLNAVLTDLLPLSSAERYLLQEFGIDVDP